MSILIVEPLGRGYSHVPTNSGFIATVVAAFPDDTISFLAEDSHRQLVREHLALRSYSIDDQIQWLDGSVTFNQKLYDQTVWQQRRYSLKTSLDEAQRLDVHTIIFLSLDGIGLIVLKWLLLYQNHRPRILCVMHGVMTKITESRYALKTQLFRYLLIVGNNRMRLKFLVIAPTIYKNSVASFPRLAPFLEWIDHPHLFALRERYVSHSLDSRQIVFGFLGAGTRMKGFDIFEQLSITVPKSTPNDVSAPEFRAIGHSIESTRSQSSLSRTLAESYMPVNEYADEIQRVDYVIFPYAAHHYALRASAAIFDALEHLKPIIAFRIPLFEDYFDRMGNIGYLCDTYEELQGLLIQLTSTKPNEEYLSQQTTIQNSRHIFEPRRLVIDMRRIINSY